MRRPLPPTDTGRAAHAAGIQRAPSLSEVNRRRNQLWTLSIIVVAVVTLATALFSLVPELYPQSLELPELSTWFVVVFVVGLALAFLIYVVEKERRLRELTDLLVEERVRTEQERETIARLQELDRMKSDFVAMVSHELKTPLTAIIGAAKTIRGRDAQLTTEQRATFVEMMERQGERLLRMVEEVLTASRIEAGKPRLQREEVDLRELTDGVVNDLLHSPIGVGREVEIATEPERPTVWGDRAALHHIVGNLTENALKYSEEGKVHVSVVELPAEVTIKVSDSGSGMTPEQITSVFDRFRRAVANEPRVSGFGLGLYIVKNLVDAHNGRIDVTSEVDVGSTFSVHLPRRAGDRGLGAPAPPPPVATSSSGA